MSLLLIVSIVVRLAAIVWAMAWSLVLFRRLRDWRMGFLTVVLSLMVLRESLTLLGRDEFGIIAVVSGAAEQPGIVLSIALFIAIPLVARMFTEHREAERALRASEERCRDLVENARDLIYTHDLNGNYTSVNKAVERTTGYTREEALKLNFEQSVAPEFVETARRMIAAKLAGQKETVYDLEIIAKDGRRLTVEVNTRLVFQDDVPIGVQGIARDVTARKRVEEALRASQAHLQAILDNCPAMIFQKDLEGRYLQVNLQFERTFKLLPEQVLGRTDNELFPPEMAAAFRATDRKVIEAGRALEFDESAEYDDGVHTYIVHKFPLQDTAGNVYAVGGVSTDITQRKRAEVNLRKQTEILQKIFDHIPVMIRFLDEDGRVKLVNREWERTLGWSLEEIVCRDVDIFAELYPDPQYRAEVLNFIGASTGEFTDLKTRTRDGRVIDTTFANIRLEDGTNIGIGRDITERKVAEASVREAQARTESVLASVADAHILLDRDWRYIYVNKAAVDGLGLPREQILGRTLWELYPDIVGTELDRQYHRAMDERVAVSFDFYYPTLDTWWANHFYPVPEGLAVFATNITERRRAEEVALRRSAQLAALHEIELEISSQHELSQVLDVVTKRAAELLDAFHCSIYIHEQEKDQLRLVASLDSDIIGLRLQKGEGLAGRAAVDGKVQSVDDYRAWQGRAAVFEGKEFGPALSVPLKWQQTVIGAISLARKQGEEKFTRDDLNLIEQLAAEAAIAIHQATLFNEVEESRRRLQELSHRLIDAQEAERKRLARELHDQIGQALTAVQISIQGLQPTCGGACAGALDDCLTVIDDALQQVHDLSLDLRPSLLDDLGLVAALRWYVDRVARRAGLVRCFNSNLPETRLTPEIEIACFRIAQEALTNVLRHAHSATVWVQVTQEDSRLSLVVRDDGVGFDARAAMGRTGVNGSLGLQGMQERASALGGIVNIRSQPGNGAEVRVSFPLAVSHSA